MFWNEQRVVVTGGAGFLGSFVVEKLRDLGCPEIFVPRSRAYDLREAADVARLYETARPTLVIHLAAVVGGIGANRAHPGKFFYDNAMMGLLLIEQARRFEVPKFVALGTVCAYPKFAAVPFRETDFWNGYPEETNAPYGLAKKMLLVQAQAYRAEYGYNAIFLVPVNLYGPRDNFDPAVSHVIPALIRKAVEAREQDAPAIELWGDGTPTREFLHAADAADAIVLAAERYNGAEPVNIGAGEEISIADLARLICDEVGYRGRLVWNAALPNGQPRRRLDVSRARELFGFTASRPLREGLRETISWYQGNRPRQRAQATASAPLHERTTH